MHCFYKLLVNRNQPTLAGQQRHCWRQIDKRKHTRKRFGACVCVSIIVYLMLWNHSDVDVEMMKASRPRWNVESHSDGEQVLGRNHPLQRWAPCLPTFNLFVPGLSWNMRCIEWFKRGRANRYQHVQNELWHLMAIMTATCRENLTCGIMKGSCNVQAFPCLCPLAQILHAAFQNGQEQFLIVFGQL